MGTSLNCAKSCSNTKKQENISSIEVPQRNEINFDDIIEIIKKDELNSYKKPPSNILLKHFTKLIPIYISSDPSYKKQKLEDAIMNINSTRAKGNNDYEFEDMYFSSELKNCTYIDKNFKINKMITKRDIEELSKYKFVKLSAIPAFRAYFSTNSNENKYENNKNTNNLLAFRFPNPSETEIDDNVIFGQYGNVNLYNSIVHLTSKENWLTNILKFDSLKKLYVILVYIQGKPKYVLLDENIPCSQISSKVDKSEFIPAFIFSRNKFWISLIEKAYAKLNRSYGNTIRNLSSEIFPVMTNAPMDSIIHNLNEIREVWDTLNNAIDQNWIIFSEFESITLEHYNFENFLSYFIVNTHRVNKNRYIEITLTVSENDIKALQKFKSKAMEEIPIKDLKDKESFPDDKLRNDKIIFMNFESFYKSFYKTVILKYQSNYHYSFKKIRYRPKQFNVAKLKIKIPTKLFLTLHSKQVRYYMKQNNYEVPISRIIIAKLKHDESENIQYMQNMQNSENSNYSNLKLFHDNININADPNSSSMTHNNLLHSLDSKSIKHIDFESDSENEFKLEYVNSAYGRQEKHILELDLDEGEYYIFFKVYTDSEFNLVLSTYSDSKIQFEENFDETDLKILEFKNKNNSPRANLLTCLNEMFSTYLDSKSDDQLIEKESEMFYSFSLTDVRLGFSLLRVENNTKDKILHMNCSYVNYGMNLLSHERTSTKEDNTTTTNSKNKSILSSRSKEVYIDVHPGGKEIIVFEWVKNYNEISINIKPTFKVESIIPVFTDKDFSTRIKNYITKEIFYYEVTYFKGIYFILVNESLKDYLITVEFESLENLFLYHPRAKGRRSLEIFLAPESKSYLNLKIIYYEEDIYFYCIKFGSKNENVIVKSGISEKEKEKNQNKNQNQDHNSLTSDKFLVEG